VVDDHSHYGGWGGRHNGGERIDEPEVQQVGRRSPCYECRWIIEGCEQPGGGSASSFLVNDISAGLQQREICTAGGAGRPVKAQA
jgi:hypothetical protein